MYLSPGDYEVIFSMQEIMEKVKFKETCWIWTGSYKTNTKGPLFIFRYDNELMSIHPAKILGMLVLGNPIRLTDKKCKRHSCVNPGHYLV